MTGSRDVYRFGDVTVEPATFQLLRDGRPVRIEPKALELLIHLIERRDRVVPKQEILDHVWKGVVVTENALTRAIAQVRKVIGDDPESPRYIQTVPTRGYRFIAEVDESEGGVAMEKAAQVIDASSRFVEAAEPPPRASGQARRVAVVLLLFMAGALLVVLTAIIVLIGVAGHERRTTAAASRTVQPVAARALTPAGGLKAFPAFSPDGNSIAYTSTDPNGVPHVYKIQVDGGEPVQLTAGDGESQPSWSPDGERIAYVAPRAGGIWVAPAGGGQAVRLTDFGSRPAWSPDGSEIAFQSGSRIDYGWTAYDADPPSTIWIVNVRTRKAAPLTQAGKPLGGHSSPSWRSDGMRLAFTSCDLESCGVYTIARNSSGLTPIMHGLRKLASPAYARDGTGVYLVEVRYNNSVLMWRPVDRDGAPVDEPITMRTSDRGVMQNIAISRDGSRLAWVLTEEASDLLSVPAIGGNSVPITRNPTLRVTFPAFSPDGGKVAYSAFAAGQDSGVWVSDVDGKNPRALDVGAPLKQHVQWSRGGWNVFFAMWHNNGPAVSKVSLIDGRSSIFKQLKHGDFAPVVSPDEKWIAFNRTLSGATTVWIAGVDGSERQLTKVSDMARYPMWSPSGRQIAVQVRTGDGSVVAVVPFAGGPLRVVTSTGGESWPYGWSADEKEIAFAGQRGGIWNVYTVRVAGGQLRQVTNNALLTNWVRSPAWSPVGDRIIYESDTARSTLWVSEPRAAQ